MSAYILIVDDEADIRSLVQGILQDEGYETAMAANSDEAYASIKARTPDLIVQDIWLQESAHDGLEILQTVKNDHPDLPVIMISGHGTIETAVSSIKDGAYDFIEKPFKSDRLILMIRRALENAALRRENAALKQRSEGVSDLVGESPAIQNLKHVLERVAQTNSRVFLTGEPGVGKDIAARLIYKLSKRAHMPFLVLNCATMRPDRLEIELFGAVHGVIEEGAQTGVLERANGGTLFLDEVADMPLETQGKIVRVLQDKKFQKIGDHDLTDSDVRIIASSNRDLEEEIRKGNFRQDLYYRLNVVPVEVPALRERRQDIPALVAYFTEMISKDSGLPQPGFTAAALSVLQGYGWPGNVRQLRNMVEWSVIMNGASGTIDVDGLPPEITNRAPQAERGGHIAQPNQNMMGLPLRQAREMFEREYLQMQVERFKGNVSRTAKFIGMERSALHRKLKSLSVEAGSSLKAGQSDLNHPEQKEA